MLRCLVLFLVLAVSPAAAADRLPNAAALFGARETIQNMDISPDGRSVLYLTPAGPRGTALVVQRIEGEPRVVTRSTGAPERLLWCNFITNERVICRVHMMMTEGHLLVPYVRLIAIDSDGGNLRHLGQRNTGNETRLRTYDGTIIDWLPGQDAVVLMSREYIPDSGTADSRMVRRESGLGVDRLDVRTLRATRVESPNDMASAFMSDGRGNVRIRAAQRVRGSTGQMRDRVDYFYRVQGSSQWRPFSSVDDSGSDFMPIAVDPELDAAYALRKLNGRYALYRVSLDGSMRSELIFAHDRVDVDDVVRVSHGSRIVGLTFAEERRRVHYFDPEYEQLAAQLRAALPNLPMIDFVGASEDNQRLLIHAGSDFDPGRYFVFDRAASNLAEIGLVRPQLENVRLANVRPITYSARDGVSIPGYLTLPPGREARGLPAIVLPHGGPSARDEWGFDWLAQYFAHQGYAVLQPNYRGSAGFGDAWLQQNGFQGWQTSIGDVVAGAHWLASEGIADRERIAIVGWSYGGYAALQAGVVEPELFRAIVAIAPVTDLNQLRQDYRAYTNSALVDRFVGEGPHVVQGSPLRNVQRIAAPVLLFHGDRDLNVRVVHSRRMHDALRDARRRSGLRVWDDLEHDLADSAARAEMLTEISALLDERVGR